MKKFFYSIIALASIAFTFTSCEDVASPYDIPQKSVGDVIAPLGDGTAANPYNVAAIDSILDSGFSTEDETSNPFYYIKGIVSSRPSINISYGNATYYISDDGTSNNALYIYRSFALDSVKFASEDELKYGDTVVVHTQVYSYSGTYETRSNTCKLVSVNGKTTGGSSSSDVAPAGSGTETDPYNVAGITQYTKSLGSDVNSPNNVYFKGKVSKVSSIDTGTYGNATFYISDDGSTSSQQFYVFRCYDLNNQKFTSENVKVGDDVVICGTVVNYKGNTPETVTGKSYIYSITHNNAGGDVPSGAGTKDSPYSVANAMTVIGKLASDENTSAEIYVSGKVSQIGKLGTSGQLIYYISDDGSTTNQLEVYYGNYLGNVAFTSADQIKVGDAVIVCGTATNYKGNTPEFVSGKSYIYSLNGKTAGGSSSSSEGVVFDGSTVTLSSGLTAGTESVTMTVNDLGLDDKASAVGTYKFSDGTTLTIAQGEGKSGPTYYKVSNGFRIYASNTLTFTATKNIAKIVMECDSYGGTDYVGNTTATFKASGNTATYCNYISANSGGVQLRAKKITIYYAASSSAKRYARARR